MSQSFFADPKLRTSLAEINEQNQVNFDEALKDHCTFRLGGPADAMVFVKTASDIQKNLEFAKQHTIPYFILGAGANILVADKGIRGLIINTCTMNKLSCSGNEISLDAGCLISDASAQAANKGLSGLEFIYSMPGTCGGAVYMNARCYGSEISDVLTEIRYLNELNQEAIMLPRKEEFSYKNTPFMKNPWVILGAKFLLKSGDSQESWKLMKNNEEDRNKKGHFYLPCAGSIFKNDHRFGEPSGKLIDSLGLRGFCLGKAQVSPRHANIIVNLGGARAQDVLALIEHLQNAVFKAYGFELEPEVQKLGEWS